MQEDQRGPIESKLYECGQSGRVLALVIDRYGGVSSDLSLILDLVAREMARLLMYVGGVVLLRNFPLVGEVLVLSSLV
jgi:hypothetical protein